MKWMKKFLYLSGGNLEKFFAEGTCPEKLLYERFLQSKSNKQHENSFFFGVKGGFPTHSQV